MSLDELIERARNYKPTPEDREGAAAELRLRQLPHRESEYHKSDSRIGQPKILKTSSLKIPPSTPAWD